MPATEVTSAPSAPKAPATPEVQRTAPNPATNPTKPIRKDAIALEVDSDPRVQAVWGTGVKDTVDRARDEVYHGIFLTKQAEINSDPRVLEATTKDPLTLEGAGPVRGRISRDTWGKFAEQNPYAAERLSSQVPEVKNAIELYRNNQITEARNAVQARINGLVAGDGGLTEDKARAQAWDEYVATSPDGSARFLADSGIDHSLTEAYTRHETQQETPANKTVIAVDAEAAARADGAGAGLVDLAASKRVAKTPSYQPASNFPISSAAHPAHVDAERNPVFWDDKTLGVAPKPDAIPAGSKKEAKAPASPKPETGTAEAPDRIEEAVLNKKAAKTALAAARAKETPPEEIAMLEKAAQDANAEYASALTDRDAAVVDARITNLQNSFDALKTQLMEATKGKGPKAPESKDQRVKALMQEVEKLSDEERKSLLATILEVLAAATIGTVGEAVGSAQASAPPGNPTRPS